MTPFWEIVVEQPADLKALADAMEEKGAYAWAAKCRWLIAEGKWPRRSQASASGSAGWKNRVPTYSWSMAIGEIKRKSHNLPNRFFAAHPYGIPANRHQRFVSPHAAIWAVIVNGLRVDAVDGTSIGGVD